MAEVRTEGATRKAGSKSARRRAREFALQGIYQWLLNATAADEITRQFSEKKEFARTDGVHFSGLLYGVLQHVDGLRAALKPHLDRPIAELSPVEHAILLLAAQELTAYAEIPYKVVINEAVELAKTFGGADGHKYINGVLDQLAGKLRSAELHRTD